MASQEPASANPPVHQQLLLPVRFSPEMHFTAMGDCVLHFVSFPLHATNMIRFTSSLEYSHGILSVPVCLVISPSLVLMTGKGSWGLQSSSGFNSGALTSCSSDETLMTFDRFKAQDVF
jgi:hypothetical protein